MDYRKEEAWNETGTASQTLLTVADCHREQFLMKQCFLKLLQHRSDIPSQRSSKIYQGPKRAQSRVSDTAAFAWYGGWEAQTFAIREKISDDEMTIASDDISLDSFGYPPVEQFRLPGYHKRNSAKCGGKKITVHHIKNDCSDDGRTVGEGESIGGVLINHGGVLPSHSSSMTIRESNYSEMNESGENTALHDNSYVSDSPPPPPPPPSIRAHVRSSWDQKTYASMHQSVASELRYRSRVSLLEPSTELAGSNQFARERSAPARRSLESLDYLDNVTDSYFAQTDLRLACDSYYLQRAAARGLRRWRARRIPPRRESWCKTTTFLSMYQYFSYHATKVLATLSQKSKNCVAESSALCWFEKKKCSLVFESFRGLLTERKRRRRRLRDVLLLHRILKQQWFLSKIHERTFVLSSIRHNKNKARKYHEKLLKRRCLVRLLALTSKTRSHFLPLSSRAPAVYFTRWRHHFDLACRRYENYFTGKDFHRTRTLSRGMHQLSRGTRMVTKQLVSLDFAADYVQQRLVQKAFCAFLSLIPSTEKPTKFIGSELSSKEKSLRMEIASIGSHAIFLIHQKKYGSDLILLKRSLRRAMKWAQTMCIQQLIMSAAHLHWSVRSTRRALRFFFSFAHERKRRTLLGVAHVSTQSFSPDSPKLQIHNDAPEDGEKGFVDEGRAISLRVHTISSNYLLHRALSLWHLAFKASCHYRFLQMQRGITALLTFLTRRTVSVQLYSLGENFHRLNSKRAAFVILKKKLLKYLEPSPT